MTVIESVNPRTLSQKDLEKIVEIEQDMWAREDGLGEYMKCETCGKIHSKEDIFGHISKDIKIQTVKKIEEIIDFDIVCSACSSELKSIYDRGEYINSIISRYKDSIESFLTVYRDDEGEIRGFFDGYIDSFENIYEREFNTYYGELGIEIIEKKIEEKLGYKIPDNIFIFSSVGIEKKYINFITYLNLLKTLFSSISDTKNTYLGITDVRIGSNISNLYKSLGSVPLNLHNSFDFKLNSFNKNNSVVTDLYLHTNVVNDYKKEFRLPIKEFLLKYKSSLKVA